MTDGRHVILIVDDNITNLKVAIEHLQIYHFDILTARSGEAGLARGLLEWRASELPLEPADGYVADH